MRPSIGVGGTAVGLKSLLSKLDEKFRPSPEQIEATIDEIEKLSPKNQQKVLKLIRKGRAK